MAQSNTQAMLFPNVNRQKRFKVHVSNLNFRKDEGEP